MIIVDAANDCYATWKVYQVLEILRQETHSIEMPEVIDYFEYWKGNRIKKVRGLLIDVRTHGEIVEMELCHLIAAQVSPEERGIMREELYQRLSKYGRRRLLKMKEVMSDR